MSAAKFWAPIALVLTAAAVVIMVVIHKQGPDHRLVLDVPEANSLFAGQDVKSGGGNIGEIGEVKARDGGRSAQVELLIKDGSWPIRKGSTFTFRWGGTLSAINRHILVSRGAEDAEPYAEDEVVRSADIEIPAEFDQIITTFREKERQGLKRFLDEGGQAMRRSRQPLRDALVAAPPAVQEVSYVLEDLTADREALDTVVRSSSNVVGAIQRSDPSFGRLLEGAAGTFDAVADSEADLRTTLERLPTALRSIQAFTPDINTTLADAADLTDRLRPGVRELRAIAQPLNGVLDAVSDIGPPAVTTLQVARASSPRITTLLERVGVVAPELEETLTKANAELRCIRPYTPELMGLFMTWGDFMSHDDGDKYIRAAVQNFVPAAYNAVSYTPAAAKQIFPDLRYGFPRPPGYLADQPWYLPSCGAGRDAVDPTKDQEGVVYDGAQPPPVRGAG